MITESTIIKMNIAGATVSLAGTDMITRHLPMFTGDHELNFVMWLIGGMLSIIMGMMGLAVWYIKDMRSSNKDQHLIMFKGINKSATELATLQGEHSAAFNAQGCAYDDERLQAHITKAVASAMVLHSHCRHDDVNG